MRPIMLYTHKLTSFTEKAIGLIGKKHIVPIRFTTTWGIHTWFVLKPIDVLLVKDQKIVASKTLQPWRIWIWGSKEYMVYELPAGTIHQDHISPGRTVVDTDSALSQV